MPAGYNTISTFSPDQQQLFSQLSQLLGPLLNQSGGYLQDLLSGSPESFQSFSAPYERQFREQTVPALAEQFAGVGGLSSSGFQQALGQAGAGLSENLASLREGLRSQIPGQIMSNLQNLLGMQSQAFLPKAPKQNSFLKQLLLGLTGSVGQGLGTLGSMSLLRRPSPEGSSPEGGF